MSDLKPLAPHLAPLADALDAAAEAGRAEEAEAARRAEAERLARQEAADLEEDAAAIKGAFKRGGLKLAKAVGRASGWTSDQVEELLTPKPKPRPPAAGPARPSDPVPGDDGAGGGPPPPPEEGGGFEREKRPILPLPADCPVTPLGVNGRSCFYLSPAGQLIELDTHGADALRGLFASRNDWLWGFAPKFSAQTGKQSGWKADRTADALIDACGRKGVFDPFNRLRGVGAWATDNDELVLHCGDVLLHVAPGESGATEIREIRPGEVGPYVYPGGQAIPRPADVPDGMAGVPARDCTDKLLAMLDTWPFTGDLDPDTGKPARLDEGYPRLPSILLLGWIGAALLGGALDWRPMIWITGDAGSGKSFLQKLIARLMQGSLVSVGDATAAGVYQEIGYSSRAVALDESENDPNSLALNRMVKLAREAASGQVMLRGSSDHKSKGFVVRSAFLFSSIIMPPLNSQDLTRITILELGKLDPDAKPPKLDAAELAHIGRMLRRRLIAGWTRWPETLERYRAALATQGHTARGADQYGTLLAMADLLRFDGAADSDTVQLLAAACARTKLEADQEAPSNAAAMLNWLLSKPLESVFRGGNRMTIGQLVAMAAGIIEPKENTQEGCAAQLIAWGVYVEGMRDTATVTLPNQHAGLAQLLNDTAWRTAPGAVTSGWSQAMRRLPGAVPVNSRKHGGRGWRVSAATFLMNDQPE